MPYMEYIPEEPDFRSACPTCQYPCHEHELLIHKGELMCMDCKEGRSDWEEMAAE